MEKVYCSECRYCDDTYYYREHYTCTHGDENWYSKENGYINCCSKNKHNDCKDFEPTFGLMLKQWIIKLITPRK